MPKPCKETRDALNALQNAPTHRAKCDALGLPRHWRGTIGRILNGFDVSLEKENEVRHRLALSPILMPLYHLPPCPDCGNTPHTVRCNGREVVDVVTLAPGEVVKRNGKARRRSPAWRPYLPADLKARCERAGLDIRTVLEEALIDATIRHYADGG